MTIDIHRLRDVMTALATAGALVLSTWALATTSRPLWPDSASPTSVARSERVLAPGQSVSVDVDPRGRAWSGLEIPLVGGSAGSVDVKLEAGGRTLGSARISLNGEEALFLPASVLPSGEPHRLVVSRPADSQDSVVLKTRHRGDEASVAYTWYQTWEWRSIAQSTLSAAAANGPTLVIALVWLFSPGFLVWRLIGRPFNGSRPADRLSLASLWVGLSVGTVLLFAALLSFQPVRLMAPAGPMLLRALTLLLALAALWQLAPARIPATWRQLLPRLASIRRATMNGTVALFIVSASIVATRAASTVDLGGPPGNDSTSIVSFARRIQERGSMLDVSLAAIEARVDLYHLGLATLVATVSTVAGRSPDGPLVVLGQTMQIVALLGIVMLVRHWRGSPWAATAGVLVAGFVFPLPGFLLAWSRWTEISGLALVAPLFVLCSLILASRSRAEAAKLAVGVGLIGAGIALTHYSVLAFALAASPVVLLSPTLRRRFSKLGLALLVLTVFAVAILLSPWLHAVAERFWLPTASAAPGGPQSFPDWTLRNGGSDSVLATLALATVPIVWLARKAHPIRPLLAILWSVLVAVAFTVPGVLGWRLGVAVNPLAAAIAYYLPIACWSAWAVGNLVSAVPRRLKLGMPLTIGVVGLLAALSNRPATLDSRLGDLLFLTDADRAAMDWIQRETPLDARFAVNPSEWAYGLITGSDGGYWLQNLTGRKTLVPPLNYGYAPQAVVDSQSAAMRLTLLNADNPSALLRIWREQGYGYLYLGRRGGPIDPRIWDGDQRVRLLYDRDGVRVYALPPGEVG